MLQNFFTKENVTFILSLIGSIGTAVGIIRAFITSRTNFYIETGKFIPTGSSIIAYLMFINKSNSPLVITSVSILINNVYYPADLAPQRVLRIEHRVNNELTDTHSEYSMPFPIVLHGNFATSGYVHFSLPQGTSVPDAKIFSLKVCTSNGMAVEKLLELDARH